MTKKYTSTRLRRGIGLPTTLAMVTIGTVMAVGILGVSTTSAKVTHRAEGYVQATALAESGANVLYSQIRQEMVDKNTYPAALAATKALVSGKEVGSFSARVVDMDETITPILDPGTGTPTGETRFYVFQVEGSGAANKGPVATVRAQFSGTVVYSYGVNPGASLSLKAGAIVANDKISMVTDNRPGGIKTTDKSGLRSAHMIANNGMTWMPLSQPKVCTTNSDWIQVDGGYLVPDRSYAWTIGEDGMGNGNESKNYLSEELTETDYHRSVTQHEVGHLIGDYQFPAPDQVDKLVTTWQKAVEGGTVHPALSAKTLVNDPVLKFKCLKAPCTVNGNLTVNANLTLVPNADPAKNVIYVKGNVSVSNRLRNRGVTIVVEGRYNDTGSAGYDLNAPGKDVDANKDGKADTQVDADCANWGITTVRRKASLMVLAKTKSACSFNSTNPGELGLVFALRGGISVKSPNAKLAGMLMAGGTGDLGQIELLPTSGAAFQTDYYPDYAATRQWGSAAPPVPTITQPFTAQRLGRWIQTK